MSTLTALPPGLSGELSTGPSVGLQEPSQVRALIFGVHVVPYPNELSLPRSGVLDVVIFATVALVPLSVVAFVFISLYRAGTTGRRTVPSEENEAAADRAKSSC